ncbi:MAG: hypothetical protein ACD_51C00024G0006 [uncultured bacterium]|nr:MAG: hypothetical protein ACD_51C00024G0006 [uncultured bacterium]OGJ47591.1 MAG: hypothetical protein A2244_00815 [Candidatus Peregrinibacteria bacterium RIFOXYA2_FULL_41_18]OGJ49608.1 MAG: hypothetical protein A2344_02295 [Candidatus Peregrinibacteria bacterium RIFOXYB12_FULL_41_12]OGJ52754.1 MAG: hypothetical protein A2448_03510 [Candidatus Peregrinibacteria bacterium RIFOXYC2_FULL_41_22]OGJ54296.1 MAG: hypothetical protein A2336_04650 [Candidatus Peregrinibacteria bacterium RIFOXYB2_FULL
MKYDFLKNAAADKRGFTLIELLVVITILGVLGYVVMADYISEVKKSKVRVSGESVYAELQDLRSRVADGSYFNDGAEDIFYCWSMVVTETDIEVFYMDYSAESGCDYDGMTVYSGGGGILLPDGVAVSVGGVEGDNFLVVFEPPYGDMIILKQTDIGVREELDTLEISLSGENVDSNKFVRLNSLTGSISLENE